MPLWPRSRRGTWALAAVAWLAGCGAIWEVTPCRPRAVIPAALAGYPTGGGNGFLLTQDYGTRPRPTPFRGTVNTEEQPAADGPFRIWDIDTGRLVASLPLNPKTPKVWICLSPDRGTAVVS